MNETVLAKNSTRVITGIQQYISTKRAAFVRRVAVILLLLYFAVMVDAGSYVRGDLESGFYFTNTGHGLFPFPYSGGFSYPVYVYFDPLSTFIYVVFIAQGIWIAWMSLGIIYIMMPLALWVYNTMGRLNSKTTQVRSDRVKKGDVLTRIFAGFSAIFSVTTFSIGYNLENYGPLPLILVLGLSTMMVYSLRIPKMKMDQ